MSQRSPFNERTQKGASSGMTKRGSGKAKPAREAAQTVRVAPASSGSKKKSTPSAGRTPNYATMTKEEKKEARRAERDAEDRVNLVTNVLVRKDPEYARRRKLWWIMLGVGLGMTVISFGLMYLVPEASTSLSTPSGMAAVVTLVLAYAGILGALIYDFVRIRPIRNETDAKVKAMSDRKRQSILDEDYAAEEARRVAREAKRQARK